MNASQWEVFKHDMIENKFSSLPDDEKVSMISHEVALRLSEWKKRLFGADSKIRFFEEKYRISLVELDTKGLPDDADHEMQALVQFNWWTQVSDIISIIFLLLAKRYSENLSNDTHNCLKLHPFFCDGLHSTEKLLGINVYCHA